MRYAILGLAMLGAMVASPAKGWSGNDFIALCGSDPKRDRCDMYMLGWLGGFRGMNEAMLLAAGATLEQINQNALRNPVAKICLPLEVTPGQLVAVLLKYLRDNPGTRHFENRVLIHHAFHKAFPCKR